MLVGVCPLSHPYSLQIANAIEMAKSKVIQLLDSTEKYLKQDLSSLDNELIWIKVEAVGICSDQFQ